MYYHLTLAENVSSIREKGLVPQIGERALEAGETEPFIFLFPTIGDLENALNNWLGCWFDEHYGPECKLATVRVEVPGSIEIVEGEAPYEFVCKNVILPEYLTFYDDLGRPLFLNSPSVDERIEKAEEVFEMMEKFDHFRKENCLEKD